MRLWILPALCLALVCGCSIEAEQVITPTDATLEIEKSLPSKAMMARFSRDGERVLVTGSYESPRLYDIATGEVAKIFDVDSQHIWTAEFSPDGEFVATAGTFRMQRSQKYWPVDIWEVKTGRKIRSLQTYSGDDILALAFTPDGRNVIFGGASPGLLIWAIDGTQGPIMQKLQGQIGGPYASLAVHPHGTHVATATSGSVIEIATDKSTLPDYKVIPHRIRYSADGSRIIAVGSNLENPDTYVTILHSLTGENLGSIVAARSLSSREVALAVAPKSGVFAIGNQDGLVNILRVADGSLVASIALDKTMPIRDLDFSPDGKRIVVAREHMIQILRVQE